MLSVKSIKVSICKACHVLRGTCYE